MKEDACWEGSPAYGELLLGSVEIRLRGDARQQNGERFISHESAL